MEVKIIHNRYEVYKFLKNRSKYDYIYQFFDLEEHNWQNVICYGLYNNKELKQIAVLAINYGVPVILAACWQDTELNFELLRRIKAFLPSEFYVHIDKETLKHVFDEKDVHDLHEYMNMGLDTKFDLQAKSCAVRLGYEHIQDIKELLAVSNPEAWLDDELVKLRRNFGIYENNKLVSFAGIHAYSAEFQVAAIAHITTHPDYRRKGYGESVIGALIRDLQKDIKYIGLNVKEDNIAAVNCYKKLGFKEYGSFVACELKLNR